MKFIVCIAAAICCAPVVFGQGWTRIAKRVAETTVEAAEFVRKAAGSDAEDVSGATAMPTNDTASASEEISETGEVIVSEHRNTDSPEYCIEHNIEMSAVALRVVMKEMSFTSNTDNKIYDEELEKRHRARFLGKRIAISGTIKKVTTTFFGEVKFIIDVSGGTVSARFDEMTRSEAVQFRPGQTLSFDGIVSTRKVISSIAMDSCKIRNTQ